MKYRVQEIIIPENDMIDLRFFRIIKVLKANFDNDNKEYKLTCLIEEDGWKA